MIKIICLFGPSLIGMFIFNKLNDKSSVKELIINYGVNNLLVNFFTILIFIVILEVKLNIEEALILYPAFALKYILISSFLSLIFIFMTEVISKNLKIKMVINEKDK